MEKLSIQKGQSCTDLATDFEDLVKKSNNVFMPYNSIGENSIAKCAFDIYIVQRRWE